jgi:flavin reductase (DIM6/NTAB) family NADH-FMN oxidoreductase RutF
VSGVEVDPSVFRNLLGRFATGVTVLTIPGPDGRPAGMTASSLASVSLEPPLLSVCVDRQADLHDLIVSAPGFVVNVLESAQEELSRRFSEEHPDRFAGVGYHLGPSGEVVLDDTLAHIECRRYALYDGGDHSIILGLVTGGAAGSGRGRPLLYYRGGYAALG